MNPYLVLQERAEDPACVCGGGGGVGGRRGWAMRIVRIKCSGCSYNPPRGSLDLIHLGPIDTCLRMVLQPGPCWGKLQSPKDT